MAKQPSAAQPKGIPLSHRIARNKWVYILFIPAIVYFSVFHYSSYYGISIAFKDFKPFIGIAGSEWVGFKHFRYIFEDPNFLRLLYNTLKISIMRIIFSFPVPIIFALLMNEVRNMRFKKSEHPDSCFFAGSLRGHHPAPDRQSSPNR